MFTLNSITTDIASSLKKELDEPFKRIIAEKVDVWRSRLIRNSLQDKPLERKFFRQTLYLSMAKVDPLPGCLAAPVCNILAGTIKVPRPLRTSELLFDFVGSVDGKTPFREAAPGTGFFAMQGKYSHGTIYFEYSDIPSIGRTISITKDGEVIPVIRIDGIFDQPWEVMQINCACGFDCDYWDKEYPVTGDILQLIIQSILQVDFGKTQQELSDEKDIKVNA